MNSSFDECAKILASDCSRRQMMGRLAGVIAGTFAGVFGPTAQVGAETPGNCQTYCGPRPRLTSQLARYTQCLNVCAACPSISQLRNNGFTVSCSGCPAGQVSCGNVCKNLSNDVNNCGQCNRVCGGVAHAARFACQLGRCTFFACTGGFADCNEVYADGCETDLQNYRNNCGRCGKVCDFEQVCVAGICGDGGGG